MEDTIDYSPAKLLARASTDEAFLSERARAARIASRWFKVARVCSILWFGSLLLTGLCSAYQGVHLSAFLFQLPMPLQVLLGTLATVGLYLGLLSFGIQEHYTQMSEACAPLSDTDYCLHANRLVQDFPAARIVRDEALAQGRQLYVADYHLMLKATEGCKPEVSTEALQEQCKELHLVTHNPAL